MKNNSIDKINAIKQIIYRHELFKDYTLKNWDIKDLLSKHSDYDFFLESNTCNRWMLFRISNFVRHHKVIIWLNLLETPQAANFDLQTYFYDNLKDYSIENRLSFNSLSICEFLEKLKYALDYIISNLDEIGKSIFEGKYWIDFPFDWHEYK